MGRGLIYATVSFLAGGAIGYFLSPKIVIYNHEKTSNQDTKNIPRDYISQLQESGKFINEDDKVDTTKGSLETITTKKDSEIDWKTDMILVFSGEESGTGKARVIDDNGFYNFVRFGTWTYFFPNGKKSREETFDEHGRIMPGSTTKEWYEDGTIMREQTYGQNLETIVNKSWFDNSQPMMFRDGNHEISWYDNGKKREEGFYDEKDNRDGTWSLWHENGQLDSEIYYENGTPIGHTVRYFPNGRVMVEGDFGKKKGDVTLWVYWGDDGIKKAEGSFFHDAAGIGYKKHGIWINYDRYGEITSKILYEKGIKIKDLPPDYSKDE